LAEVTRHAPTLIVDGTLGLLAQRGAAAPPPWQQLEAALFAAQAAAEPYLVHVVALPARRQADAADGATAAARAHLAAAVPALLAALLDPAAVAEGSALGGALLHAARCAPLRASTPTLTRTP